MKSPGFSIGKAAITTLLLLAPALFFYGFSDRGMAGWTAQAQIFHGGTTWIETELVKLESPGLLRPTAEAEAMTVPELLENWDTGLVAADFSVASLPDTQLLKLEYTSDDPSQALRVVTSVTDLYLDGAPPLANLDETRKQLLELEEDYLERLDQLLAEMESLDASSLAYSDAQATRVTLERATGDVRAELALLAADDRTMVGTHLVANPFLLPEKKSNAVTQTLLGLALGALLAGSFLLLVRSGEGRASESLAMQLGNGQEAPQAFQR